MVSYTAIARKLPFHSSLPTTYNTTQDWRESGVTDMFGVLRWWYLNAGGDAPPDPPSLVTSRAHPPFFVFSRKVFWRMSGIIFLARALRITRNYIKP